MELGLDKYVDSFIENEIDFAAAQLLDAGDLKELRLPMGPRKKLLAAITALSIGSAVEAGQNMPGQDASRRQVTVLFADISGFTKLSSGLDAEQTHAMLNHFFAAVDGIVRRHGGTVDKHIGDAVMAVFGAPVAHTDDPERAVRAAIDIHQAVADLTPPLQVHIGVAAGQVVASATGSATHTEFTVTGDSVNLASRLTSLAQAGETFASTSVQRALAERFDGENLGERQIAGLLEPVTVWRVHGLSQASVAPRHPFVGRRREFRRFETVLNACMETGLGETLIVRGEAGIGKTRLLNEFERHAVENGFRCHTGLVLDFGMGKGQDPVRWFVRSLLDISAGSDKSVRADAVEQAITNGLALGDQRIFLNDLLDLKQPGELRNLYDAMDNRTRNRGKLETITALVRALSERSPLLLKVEDLHWADAGLLLSVAFLVKVVGNCRAILLLTTRLAADPLDAEWHGYTGGAPLATIDLGAMDRAEALHLAREFPGIEPDLVTTCIERAGGNPLYLEQLLRNADELQSGEIPGTLQGIIQARLDALPALDRKALQVASILGQRFSSAALAALLGRYDYRADVLLSQALIRPAGEDYHFSHALIRDGVYSSLLSSQRSALHKRAAGHFMDLDPILRAEHLDAAKDSGAAAAYLLATRQSNAALRYDVALRLSRRALELHAPHDVRLELMGLQGDALRELGDTDLSIATFEQALEMAGSDAEICRVNIGLAEGLRIVDRRDSGLAALDRAEAAAGTSNDAAALARINYLRGGIYFSMGNLDGCLAAHGEALEFATLASSPEAEARALSGLGDAWYMRGRMRTAHGFFSRCITVARGHGLSGIEASNLIMRGDIDLYLGNGEAGVADIHTGIDLAQRIGDQRAVIVAKSVISHVHAEAGDGLRAEALAREMLGLCEAIGARLFSADAQYLWAHALIVQGARAAAMEHVQSAITLSRQAGMAYLGPTCLAMQALLTDDPGTAAEALAEGERILDAGAVSHNYVEFYRFAVETSLERRAWDEAERYAAAMEAYWKPEPLPRCDFTVARGRALAAAGRGGQDQALVDELRHLQDEARRMGNLIDLPAIDAALSRIRAS